MRFNSVKGGNFTSGAKAVNRSADQMFAASRESAPDFTGISKAAIASRTKERNAATESQGLKDVANIKADNLIDRTKIKVKSDKDVASAKRPAKRMAGVVAGLGSLATGAVMGLNSKTDKADQAKRDASFEQRTQALRDLVNKPPAVFKSTPYVGPEAPTFKKTIPTSTSSDSSSVTSTSVSSNGKGWSPLSKTIQFSEGTYKPDGTTNYNLGYGGTTFTDLSKHPDTVWRTDSGSSAAAGAYQFMPETYSRASNALGLTDFSATSQEKAGEWLAQKRGVDTGKLYTTRAGLKAAFHQMSPEWAGLPNNDDQSHYKGINGNKSMKFDNLVRFYEKQVGYTLK